MGNVRKIAGIVLIALGVLGLVYKGFEYTRETHEVDLGVAKFEVKDRETMAVPMWVSIAAIGAGALLLLIPGGKK
ncbi:MAG TPA: hypothetical protein VF139_00720 [Candidatus Polarisedimenticolaceae bacterium]